MELKRKQKHKQDVEMFKINVASRVIESILVVSFDENKVKRLNGMTMRPARSCRYTRDSRYHETKQSAEKWLEENSEEDVLDRRRSGGNRGKRYAFYNEKLTIVEGIRRWVEMGHKSASRNQVQYIMQNGGNLEDAVLAEGDTRNKINLDKVLATAFRPRKQVPIS